MSDARDKLLQRIQKLLRMARDKGASEGEIVTAMKAARALMTRHGIEEHDVEQGHMASDAAAVNWSAVTKHSFLRWEKQAGQAVACITDTQMVVDHRRLMFFGVGDDALLAVELYHALIPAIKSSAKLRGFKEAKGKRPAFRSYCHGFSIGLLDLADRMQKIETQAAGLIVRKAELINEHLAGKTVSTPLRPSKTNRLAFTLGRVDGRTHDFGRQKLTGVAS